jgi:hypothetical protein
VLNRWSYLVPFVPFGQGGGFLKNGESFFFASELRLYRGAKLNQGARYCSAGSPAVTPLKKSLLPSSTSFSFLKLMFFSFQKVCFVGLYPLLPVNFHLCKSY